VCVGLKDPQVPLVAQVAVQSTPPLEESLETVAHIVVVVPSPVELGGLSVNATVSG
jgi:hypothetical protein